VIRLFRKVSGYLDQFGVIITNAVSSMWCALLFACLALVSLPNAIHNGRAAIVTWIAQTFLQLVLLSIIMVGQEVQARRIEERDDETHLTVLRSYSEIIESHVELKEAHADHDNQLAIINRKLDQLLKAQRASKKNK
jgi:hypothetical protein